MVTWDRQFPAYGFKRHKGYGTRGYPFNGAPTSSVPLPSTVSPTPPSALPCISGWGQIQIEARSLAATIRRIIFGSDPGCDASRSRREMVV